MGVFECHKLLFSMQMASMILSVEMHELDAKDFDFYIKGNPALEKIKEPVPHPWISETGWKDLQLLKTLSESLRGITDELKKNGPEWQKWYDLEAPETVPMPSGYCDKIDLMKQVLLIRCLRPDRMITATKQFIAQKLSEYYVQ